MADELGSRQLGLVMVTGAVSITYALASPSAMRAPL